MYKIINNVLIIGGIDYVAINIDWSSFNYIKLDGLKETNVSIYFNNIDLVNYNYIEPDTSINNVSFKLFNNQKLVYTTQFRSGYELIHLKNDLIYPKNIIKNITERVDINSTKLTQIESIDWYIDYTDLINIINKPYMNKSDLPSMLNNIVKNRNYIDYRINYNVFYFGLNNKFLINNSIGKINGIDGTVGRLRFI